MWAVLVCWLVLSGDINAIENKPNNTSGCGADEFKCSDLSCIPNGSVCDGKADCFLEEDEANCGCKAGEFQCNNRRCISEVWRCDGDNDCMDQSDELNCTQSVGEVSGDVPCPDKHFKCGGLCILSEWLCDGNPDCIEGEDEAPEQCHNKPKTCLSGHFECEPGTCIPERWVCDGSADCGNENDEGDHCGDFRQDCDIEKGYFLCGESSNGRCLDMQHVCDGVPQCADKEDEGDFCAKEKGCQTKQCSHHCFNGPTGATCYCPVGLVLSEDKLNCTDVNECQEYGVCSQDCVNKPGSFECKCRAQYRMINNTCFAGDSDVVLYFSTEDSIRKYNVRTDEYSSVVSGLKHVVGVAYDGINDRVYWTDVRMNHEQIESVSGSGGDRQLVLNHGLDMPEDIVVDEASRNLYFTDAIKGHIVVCSLDRAVCMVLDNKNENPRGIDIHYRRSLLFYSDWGSKPAIVRMGLDGSERTNLITEGLHWPNGVAVDQELDRVYWSDAKLDLLESAKLDGSDRRIVLQEIDMMHPFSLSVFEDSLYWSDWSGQTLTACNKFTGKQKKLLVKEPGLKIMGIAIYHPLLTASDRSPCAGHRCSHLCLPKSNGSSEVAAEQTGSYTCACPAGYTLHGSICLLSHKHDLVVAVEGTLYRFDPQNVGKDQFEKINNVEGSVTNIASDLINGHIFVTESSNSKIYNFNIEANKKTVAGAEAGVSSLAYDSIDENLFWINSERREILVQSATGSKSRKVIIKNLFNPKALVVCTGRREIVFLDQKKLVAASLHGGHIRVLSDNIPDSVHKLYYAEGNDTILMGDSEARMVRTFDLATLRIGTFLSSIHGIQSMAVFDGNFYWTQTTGNELFWVKFQSGVTLKSIAWMSLSSISSNPLDIVTLAVSSNKTDVYKDVPRSCASEGCQQLCFSSADGSARCDCEMGHILLQDGKSCQTGCPADMFSCNDANQRCLEKSWVCDNEEDCLNGLDEANCTKPATCKADSEFRCRDGECIPAGYVCDTDRDCGDGSDEKNCPPLKCDQDTLYMCKDKKKCILDFWKCDGNHDCEDGSDEEDCSPPSCEANDFYCLDKSACIPSGWVCDGNHDCVDESDERNCTTTEKRCPEDKFACANTVCIDLELVCDQENDCGDGSDEAMSICHQRLGQSLNARPKCDKGFQCGDDCFPLDVRCNGTVECDDLSDEADCDVDLCTADSWRCKDNGRCIRSGWRCDGHPDCDDASDEDEGCNDTKDKFADRPLCTQDQYHCSSGECISLGSACDAVPDCQDGSDESEAKCQVCSTDNGGCHHHCQATPRGPVCSCRPGFSKKQVVGIDTCVDIDECKLISSCPQQCYNTKGSFKCSCVTGFMAEQGGDVCRALGHDPQILFATASQIKGINPLSQDHQLYANLTNFAMSFDVNQRTGQIFATVPSKRRIVVTEVEGLLTSRPRIAGQGAWLADLGRVSLVALDWVTGNIYYASLNSDTVTVCSLAKQCRPLFRSPYPVITSLAVDPAAGRIFISAFRSGFLTPAAGGVWTYGLDGRVSGTHKLSDDKLGVTMGLALDTHKQRVYWADKHRGMIMMNSYNGDNLLPVFAVSPSPAQLAVFQNTLYWLDLTAGKIAMLELRTGTHRLSPDSVHITDKSHSLRIIQDQQQQLLTNPCEEYGCSHISLLTPGGGCRCECSQGFTLSPSDGVSCAQQEDVPHTPLAPSGEDSGSGKVDGDDITKKPLVANHTATIACVVVVCLILLIACSLFVLWLKRRSNNKDEDMIAFTNRLEGEESGGPSNNNDMSKDVSGVQVMKRGTIASCDNPLYVDSPQGNNSLEFLKFGRGPRMASITGNSPSLDFTNIMSLAKGASTPTQPRKAILETDSAYNEPSVESASIDYEDLTNQHTSVSLHYGKDNDRIKLLDD